MHNAVEWQCFASQRSGFVDFLLIQNEEILVLFNYFDQKDQEMC